jgi:hypothetical protein
MNRVAVLWIETTVSRHAEDQRAERMHIGANVHIDGDRRGANDGTGQQQQQDRLAHDRSGIGRPGPW